MSASEPQVKEDSSTDWEDVKPSTAEQQSEESSSIFDAFSGKRKEGDGADFFAKLFGKANDDDDDDDDQDEGKESEADEKDKEPEQSADDEKNDKTLNHSPSSFFDSIFNFKKGSEDDKTGGVDQMIVTARKMAVSKEGGDDSMKTSESSAALDKFLNELNFVNETLKKNFSHLKLEDLNPLALLYYLETEDSKKTPSWKRRKHRFLPDIDKTTVYGIHDALYLSELSYLDTKEEIEAGLKSFVGEVSYELIYCSVKGQPREPASYVVIQKESAEKKKKSGFFFWSDDKDALEVVLVIRGTKEIGDMLSDCMLDASEYRDGISHEGVTHSGKFIVDKHLELLQYILKESGRKKMNLKIVGHSLGAGAAAIAAIEMNEQPNFNAKCIGFGCPALLNKEQSEKTKEYITTIIADSDCIPRMSGATASNLILEVMTNDWLETSLLDLEQILHVADCNLPIEIPDAKKKEIREWAVQEYEKNVKPKIKDVPKERAEVVLFPPGRCIHVYRDGVGVSACEVPCDFFDQLDLTRTMIDDHLTVSGYDKMLTELMRAHLCDSKFQFTNDVPGLRVEKKE